MPPYQQITQWFYVVALTVLLTIACTKKNPEVDPRDAYVGTWIEQSSNGVPTAATDRRDTIELTKGEGNKLRVDKLIVAGAFNASLAGTGVGYQADNTPINTGSVLVNAQNGTRSPIVLTKMQFLLSGSQLTMSVSYSAQSGSQAVQQDYVEVMTRR